MFLRLWCRAPRTTSAGPSASARRLVGTGIAALPLRYWPVSDFLLALTFAGVPGRDDLAAAVARAGAEIDEVVGRLDHLAVVLDQDQGVAQVAQVPQARRAAGHCRADAGRSSARRGRRARPSGRCRSGWPGGCAGSRRPRASACRGRATGSRARRRPGTCRRSRISRTRSPAIWRLVAGRASAP